MTSNLQHLIQKPPDFKNEPIERVLISVLLTIENSPYIWLQQYNYHYNSYLKIYFLIEMFGMLVSTGTYMLLEYFVWFIDEVLISFIRYFKFSCRRTNDDACFLCKRNIAHSLFGKYKLFLNFSKYVRQHLVFGKY